MRDANIWRNYLSIESFAMVYLGWVKISPQHGFLCEMQSAWLEKSTEMMANPPYELVTLCNVQRFFIEIGMCACVFRWQTDRGGEENNRKTEKNEHMCMKVVSSSIEILSKVKSIEIKRSTVRGDIRHYLSFFHNIVSRAFSMLLPQSLCVCQHFFFFYRIVFSVFLNICPHLSNNWQVCYYFLSLKFTFFYHVQLSLVGMEKKKGNQPTKRDIERKCEIELEPLLYWHNLVYQILPISIGNSNTSGERLAAPIAMSVEEHTRKKREE